MALLYESEVGYLICHKKHLEETYGIGFKKEYFDVSTPFLKDQEAESKARQLESGLDIKRNRKRKLCQSKLLPIAESDVNQFLHKLHEFFCEPPTAKDYYDNNKSCRKAVEQFMQTTTKIQDTTFEHDHFNPSDKIETIEILGQTYIIPQKCQFYKTDISNISCLTLTHQKFSLIVMDPPWSNRFVKRKKESSASHSGYHFMGDEVLAALPIDQLCDSRTLVAIWCTNSPSHLDYLLHTMLPTWKLKHVATWFWIKVSFYMICLFTTRVLAIARTVQLPERIFERTIY